MISGKAPGREWPCIEEVNRNARGCRLRLAVKYKVKGKVWLWRRSLRESVNNRPACASCDQKIPSLLATHANLQLDQTRNCPVPLGSYLMPAWRSLAITPIHEYVDRDTKTFVVVNRLAAGKALSSEADRGGLIPR